ncbi:hypothetical protein ALO74_200143 [Pseudomonas syringae pv. cunninghamiae]|nr:hypothetical protein ALO74_200143 [Pseudomonas syringae pv. cunninghamiae]
MTGRLPFSSGFGHHRLCACDMLRLHLLRSPPVLKHMLNIKMYPAKNGDAFLINANSTHILVDAGYASTFNTYIAPDLALISQSGGHIDLMVATHIDADHIGGVIEFVSLNGPPQSRDIIEVKDVWHNSLRSLPLQACDPNSERDRSLLESIQRRGFPIDSSPGANPIGAKQGASLARLLREKGYRWNAGDGTDCVTISPSCRSLPNRVEIRVIGPTLARLEVLRRWWIKELRRLGYKGNPATDDLIDDAYEILCASAPEPMAPSVLPIATHRACRLKEAYVADMSPTNGSSIAFILYVGETSALFLGDARAEDMVAALKQVAMEGASLQFDAIKVSHHGSLRSTNVELLSLIDAPHYFISSDGTHHDHPDFEVLAEIVDRPADFERKLYFSHESLASKRLQSHVSRSGARFSVHTAAHDWVNLKEDNK